MSARVSGYARTACRLAAIYGGVTGLVMAVELAAGWPRGTGDAAVTGLLVAQVFLWSSAWTLPLSAVALGIAALLSRARIPRPDLRLLPVIPPAALCWVLAGQWLHLWARRAFVRPALIARWLPALELLVYGAIVFFAYLGFRIARPLLSRLTRRWIAALTGVLTIGAGGLLLARSPQILEVPLLKPALVLAVAAIFAAVVTWWSGSRALGRRFLAGGAVALVLLFGDAFFLAGGGQAAPLAYPVAAGAVQRAGLMAARVAAVASGLGDGDGDGFGRYFGGLDCDDDDPLVNPQAKERPGNGVDEDCFEGDLSPEAVAADRRERDAHRKAGPPRARGLILITVDALRADALGFGGSKTPTSPNLDRLAGRAMVFSRAYSQAPRTRYSFPVILSGQYPSNVHWHVRKKGGTLTTHDDNLFLAESAKRAGIETASILAASHARLSHWDQGMVHQKVHPASHFRGQINGNILARDAVAMIQKWAAEPDHRFFLWMHFYEPHFPYQDHREYDFGRSEKAHYLEEVRYVDTQLGKIFGALKETGLDRETAIFFTADHGEEFGEHGGKYHGDLHMEDLHVPLLMRIPGIKAGVFDTPVGHVDMHATMYQVLGLDVPESVDGRSVLPWIDGEEKPPEDRYIYSERIPDEKSDQWQVSLIDRDWQFVVDLKLNSRQLYHLPDDPFGQRNVLTDYPDAARRIERILRRRLALRIGPMRVKRP